MSIISPIRSPIRSPLLSPIRGGGATGGTPPDAISDLVAAPTSDTAVALTFTPAPGATSHEYRIGAGSWVACADNSGSQSVTGLTAATAYSFTVRGVNGSGNGDASNSANATTYTAAAQTAFAAMSSQPDATRKGLINTLIAGLQADSAWTGLDWLLLLAAHDSQAARLNIRNPAKSASVVNSPTFTTDLGYTGDGSTSYIDFGEAPAAVGNSFSLNSAAVGAWCNQSNGTGLVRHLGLAGQNNITLEARASAGNESFRLNDATAVTFQANPGTRAGHRMVVRSNSSDRQGYFNGVLVANQAVASTAVGTLNVTGLRGNTTYSNDRLAVLWTGSLNEAAAIALHSRLNTFLTAIGAN